MTQMHKGFLLIGVFLYAAFVAPKIYAATPDAVNQVLQQGLPAQPAALATLTEALKKEYEARHNVVALVFYAYGLLRQADGYAATNDFIHASEYAKSGFFWLDEAVDLQEKNQRVRYLRARVDAYLPADSGRCVVTVKDTEHMLLTRRYGRQRSATIFWRCVIAHYVTARTPPARMRCWRKLKGKTPRLRSR